MLQILIKICLALTVFLSIQIQINDASRQSSIACEDHTLHIQCPVDLVISINNAFYGRSIGDFQTCNKKSLSYSWIRKKVLKATCKSSIANNTMAATCNGKGSCSIQAKNKIFGDPCKRVYKYLRVTYECKRGPFQRVACEHKTLNLACSSGQLINVKSVLYGRLRNDFTTCNNKHLWSVKKKFSYNNCNSSKSYVIVDKLCNNKEKCSILVKNSLFGDPCIGVFKYLRVSYTCEDVTPEPLTTMKPIPNECLPTNYALYKVSVIVCHDGIAILKCPNMSSIIINNVYYGTKEGDVGDFSSCSEKSLRNMLLKDQINQFESSKSSSNIALNCNGRRICPVRPNFHSFDHLFCADFRYFTVIYSCFVPKQ